MLREKPSSTNRHHRNEGEQVTERNQRRRLSAIGFVLLLRSMTKTDLLLIIQPRLVMRTHDYVQHPLHEARLHLRGIFGVARAIRTEEPLDQMRLRADHRTP